MEMKGRTMQGYIYVDHPALQLSDTTLNIRMSSLTTS